MNGISLCEDLILKRSCPADHCFVVDNCSHRQSGRRGRHCGFMQSPVKSRVIMPQISAFFVAKWMWIAGCAFCISIWATAPVAMRTLLILMCISYSTFVVSQGLQRKLTAWNGFVNLGHKVLVLLGILAIHALDSGLGLNWGAMTALSVAYSINEAIGIVEHIALAGVPVPAWVVTALLNAKNLRARPATQDELAALEGTEVTATTTTTTTMTTTPAAAAPAANTVTTTTPPIVKTVR